jgi:hypothetical protein
MHTYAQARALAQDSVSLGTPQEHERTKNKVQNSEKQQENSIPLHSQTWRANCILQGQQYQPSNATATRIRKLWL